VSGDHYTFSIQRRRNASILGNTMHTVVGLLRSVRPTNCMPPSIIKACYVAYIQWRMSQAIHSKQSCFGCFAV